jgi:hypothetical protein
METKILKPVGEAKVRNPVTKKFISPEGERVEMSSYWNRRIKDGSVVVVESKPIPVFNSSPNHPKKGHK